MRPPLLRPSLLAIAAALALSAASYAQYVTNSSSAQSQQRSLEKYGRELRDSIRSYRNTPSPRSSSESTSAWLDRMQAANEARNAARQRDIEQSRAAAEWRRDHPNETPAAYYARIERERAAAEEANARAWEEYRRVEREQILQKIAEQRRLDQLEWDRHRATIGIYSPRSRYPLFTTTTQALDWCRAHDSEDFNNWASAISALLLMDGLGVPRDLPAAAAFADPQRPFPPGSDPVHPNLQAIYLYLSTRHPELYAHHRSPPTASNSRQELVLLSQTNHFAKWLLARILADSSDPADQRQAVLILPDGYFAMYAKSTAFSSSAGYRLLDAHLKKTTWEILQRGATSLPSILAWWTPDDFTLLVPVFRDPPARAASAPGTDAISRILAMIQPYVLLNGFSDIPPPEPDPLYAIDAATFDLARASARFASAYAPGISTPDAQLALLEATRLGDAFAPIALISMLGEHSLKPDTRQRLRATSTARRARDEAARHPRALVARLIEARFQESDELKPVFTQAIAAGSILAPRAELSRRIHKVRSGENDRPPSWELPPALIAELDAAVVEINARPDHFHEWSLFPLFLSDDETKRVAYWFDGFDLWEKDRQERLADAELIRVIQPQIDAVLATLANWPGLDPYDAGRSAQLDEARQLGYKADELVTTDGTEALVLYLQAAALGDRVALDRLAGHIRLGTGQLPRSAEFADRLIAAYLKMLQGDAEVGDANAASLLGSALIYGRSIPKDRAAGLDWLRYAAGLGDRDAASKLAGQAGERGDNNPSESRHWSAVGEIIQYGENLLVPPRRLQGGVVDLTPVRSALEAALTDANSYLASPPSKAAIEAAGEAEGARYSAALELFQTDRAAGLTALAQSAARGDQYAAFATAQIVGGGRFGPQPGLARRFHALGISLLQIAAEQGDFITAHRLGLHHLELLEVRDPAAAIYWFTYAAELGYGPSADYLSDLYTTGAPGIPADPQAAARWSAFGESTMGENFKPRTPLR